MSVTILEAPSDAAELLSGIGRNDAAAWAEVIHRYERLLVAKARSFRMQDADVHDAVQMTWVRLRENGHSITRPECLAGWLLTTVTRECWLILGRNRRTLYASDVVAPIIVLSRSNPFFYVASSATEAIDHVNRYLTNAEAGRAGPRIPAVGSAELEDFEFFDGLGRQLAAGVAENKRFGSLGVDHKDEVRARITALLAEGRELTAQLPGALPGGVDPVPSTPSSTLDFEQFIAAITDGDDDGAEGAEDAGPRCRFFEWLFRLCP